MAYVITQNCCKDASCVPVCPVDCIRPIDTAGAPTTTEMLYIDPEACIDCGACMAACPVDAIHYEDDLPDSQVRFRDINAAYFDAHPLESDASPIPTKHSRVEPGALRVAIVGAGPAACYAADALIDIDGVEVSLFERLPTPFGLIRTGVAPDHQHTKSVVTAFERALTSKRLATYFNVEIGDHVRHADLLAHHHAVIYAVGASHSRTLGIAGEQLPGSHAASEFVAWYNGHPDHAWHEFDLAGRRAVVVGNGNVAVDVARVLLADIDKLEATDIADHALHALRDSAIREVVVLGRRGIRHAAFSVGEFLALGHLDGVDVVIEGADDLAGYPDDDVETALKLEIAREYAARPLIGGNKRIVFRFLASPVEITGADRVEAIVLRRNHVGDGGGLVLGDDGDREVLQTSLVLRSIGYLGDAGADLPFDACAGIIPNDKGRVMSHGTPVAGVYVTGWIKRGPRGVIGTNRRCAEETTTALLADFDSGALTRPVGSRADFETLLEERGVTPVDWAGWRAIDAAERARGASQSRPRAKLVGIPDLLSAAQQASRSPA
ncbi:FAD-dependent oxidoreductase [Mycolicibacterium monacense]|uniref:FAD-dependent oxidoreductase n=1 Tax=Mycolicibacterium monacense TaxID=85693 RepID=UPI0007EA8F35|nr:FAD-dependent oxidoreductase [Mycolicibacterium monacense]OBF51146.1 ferredoxin [Mycolicibacterium monacense]